DDSHPWVACPRGGLPRVRSVGSRLARGIRESAVHTYPHERRVPAPTLRDQLAELPGVDLPLRRAVWAAVEALACGHEDVLVVDEPHDTVQGEAPTCSSEKKPPPVLDDQDGGEQLYHNCMVIFA